MKNKYSMTLMLFFVLTFVSIPSVLAEPEEFETPTNEYETVCKGQQLYEITSFLTNKPVLACHIETLEEPMYIAYGSYYVAADGSTYQVSDENYDGHWDYLDEDGKTEIFDIVFEHWLYNGMVQTSASFKISSQPHPPKLVKVQQEAPKPIDNSIRSWINLIKTQSENPEFTTEDRKEPKIQGIEEHLVIEDEKLCNTLVENRTLPSVIKYRGIVSACLHQERIGDGWTEFWIGEDGIRYKETHGGGYERASPITMTYECDDSVFLVMERQNCNFKNFIEYEKHRAVKTFNSTNLVSEITPSFAYEFAEGMKDCAGNLVSKKTDDCSMIKKMKDEADKATFIFNGTKLSKTIKDSFTHTYPEIDQRTKFMMKHNMMWIRGAYAEVGN